MAADTAEQAPEQTAPPQDPIWSLTVDQAMVMAMREIGAVGKNGKNKEFGYQYRQQEDLVAAVRGPMAKYGVRMLPEVIDQKHFQRGKSNVAILTVRYNVRGPAGDVMEPSIVVVGEGADVSDKASNKAMTAAKKYAIVQAFEIAEANVDEGDQTSPDTEASPADWYVNQLRSDDVWYNRNALGRLRQRIFQYGHGDLVHPDTGLTLLQTIEERGEILLQRQAERDERRAGEREARDAHMRAEHPEHHRASPNDDVWQTKAAAPARQQQSRTAAPSEALPDPVDVESRLAEAMRDPQTAVKRLNEIRKHFTPSVLKQVRVQTKWGEVDGNSAITFALREVAQQGQSQSQQQRPDSAPASPPAPPSEEHQRAPEPEPTPESEPEAESEPEPEDAPPPPDDPEYAPVEEPAEESKSEPQPPQTPQPPRQPQRPARDVASMNRSERARYALEREAEFQAQMLGLPTLDHVADLLPAGASGIEDIKGNLGLQSFIVENRPAVIAALIKASMHRQAEEYSSLGQRAPALNIESIIKSALQPQTSF